MGDIGPLRREVEFEPLPDQAPVEAPTPVEPEKVPAGCDIPENIIHASVA
jgi:hypothetical protein